MKKYDEYQDSGLEWMGEIPTFWKKIRLRYVCDITTGNRDTIHQEEEGKYPFFVRSQSVKRINSFSFDGEAILTAGDGDICKIWHHIDDKFDYHQRVYMLYNFNGVNGRFLYYFLKENFIHEVLKLSAKSTVDSLRQPMFLNFPLCLPSIDEQTKIALYLDHQTGLIDTIIEKKQLHIEKLKEQRQAIINEAVTKGLNPNAPMKDSEVEWLGEIPEKWDLSYLKRYSLRITDGSHHSPKTQYSGRNYISVKDMNSDGKIDLVNCKKINDEDFEELTRNGCQPDSGDILLTKDGTIGRAGVVEQNNDFVILSSLGLVKPDKELIDSYYLRYFLISEINVSQMFSLIAGAALTRLTIDKIKHLIITIPPLKEQGLIVSYLDKELKDLDLILGQIKHSVKKLKQFRQSIISEAVTGKIDVRQWEPRLKETV